MTLTTAAVGLYNSKENGYGAGLYPPWEEGGRGKYAGKPIVIFGGASSVGQFGMYTHLASQRVISHSKQTNFSAIQLAKLSGFSLIITTASEHNTDLLESLGATHVIPRSLPTLSIAARVSEITGIDNPIEIVYDAVSTPETQQLGWDILAPGGSLALVTPPDVNLDKRGKDGEKHVIHMWHQPQLPRNRELAGKLYGKLTEWLSEGVIIVSSNDSTLFQQLLVFRY